MNKKLLSLAVAAALTAPAAVMADATLYGRLNVSLDYQKVENSIAPVYNATSRSSFVDPATGVTVPGYAGNDIFVDGSNNVSPIQVQTGTNINAATGLPLTAAEVQSLRAFQRIAPGATAGGQDFEGWGMSRGRNFQGSGRSSFLGVKGSEDLGGGLKAIYQVEFQVWTNDTDNNLVSNSDGGVTYRNTFVGLAGGWGTALMGRHDTPLKISTGKLDLFADTMADYNGTIGFQDYRADNAVAYISPSFSGFTFAAAVIPSGGATATGNYNINSDQINGGYSLAGIYSNGPFYAALAWESLNSEMFNNSATSNMTCLANDNPAAGPVDFVSYNCPQIESDQNTWKIGLGLLDWNGFTLTGIYEQQDNLPAGQNTVLWNPPNGDLSFNLPGGPDERSLWQIQAGYRFGNVMIKAMYGESEYSGDYTLPNYAARGITSANAEVLTQATDDLYNGGTSSWAIGADYNFSKRTKAYVLYTMTEADGSDTPSVQGAGGTFQASRRSEWDGFSLGMMHSF